MPSLLYDPDYCRQRADQVRQLAKLMSSTTGHAEMLKIATDYDVMARLAEARPSLDMLSGRTTIKPAVPHKARSTAGLNSAPANAVSWVAPLRRIFGK